MKREKLNEFQSKFKLSNEFTDIIYSLFEKLVKIGYVNGKTLNKLVNALYENVQSVIIGSKNELEYKTGYYNSNNKTLYIKDENNIPAIYLRVLYAICSKNIDKESSYSGYMVTRLHKDNYELEFTNFGLNRAVMSNLVCKLCNMLPLDMSIVPTYNTYTHNFLGYKIEAENNLYSLEGKTLSEICYALNIDEQHFYVGLFSENPCKYLKNLLQKRNLSVEDELFTLLDTISRKYNQYNKLCVLSKKLNQNYLEYKRHTSDSETPKIIKEKTKLESEIKKAIHSINMKSRFDIEENAKENNIEIDESLTETQNNLEQQIISSLAKLQDILCDKILIKPKNITDYEYANKLKQFYLMLIFPNYKLEKEIRSIILNKLLPEDEPTSVNLTIKIKYMLVQNILSESKYNNLSKSLTFNTVQDLVDEKKGTALVLLNANKTFARLVQIEDLNLPLENMNITPKFIPLDNFSYLLNGDYSSIYVGSIEKIFDALKLKYPEKLEKLTLDNAYIFEYNTQKYIITCTNRQNLIFKITINKDNYNIDMLDISEAYSLFEASEVKISTVSLLPTIVMPKTKISF